MKTDSVDAIFGKVGGPFFAGLFIDIHAEVSDIDAPEFYWRTVFEDEIPSRMPRNPCFPAGLSNHPLMSMTLEEKSSFVWRGNQSLFGCAVRGLMFARMSAAQAKIVKRLFLFMGCRFEGTVRDMPRF